MDQGCQKWVYHVGSADRTILRLHGVGMGWVCLHYEPDPPARFCPSVHG